MSDTEFRSSVGLIRDQLMNQSSTLNKIDSKIDALNGSIGVHGERIAKVEEKATAAHRRLDDNEKLKGSVVAWVMGIVAAGLIGAGAIAWSMVKFFLTAGGKS